MKKEMQKSAKSGYARPLKIAAWAGILIVAFSIINSIISKLFVNNASISPVWQICYGLIGLALSCTFSYGFYILGKKHNSDLLKIISLIIIAISIAAYLASIFYFSPLISSTALQIQDLIQQKAADSGISVTSFADLSDEQAALLMQQAFPVIWPLIFPVLCILLFYGFILLLSSILFGVGLIKIRKKVKYAKTAGILEIVGAATAILMLGIPVLIVAFVFQIVILFRESKS